MTRSGTAALTPLDDATALLLDGLAPVAPVALPLAEALGRFAARDVPAEADLPAGRVALRDGWAVDAARITGASPYGPVPLHRPPDWVEAGSPLPQGTDTVLPVEAIEQGEAVADAPAGDGAWSTGRDIRTGTLLLAAGARITPLHLLALAAAGLDRVAIRAPRLRLLVTGSHDLYRADALSPVLSAMSLGAGARLLGTARVPDDPDAIAAAIRPGEADAVLVLGGTGFGRSDRSAEALARAGTLKAHGIALRPGETAGFGTCEDRPVLLLPGRPEAALAAFLTLGRAMLAALSGSGPPATGSARTLRKVTSTIGLAELVFARRREHGVEPIGSAELPVARLIEADCAILVPPEREGYAEGAEVAIMTL